MTILKAVLVKRKTLDGLVEIWPNIPLGREYHVYLESKRDACLFHSPSGTHHHKEIIDTVEGGWLVTELLEIGIERKPKN